MTTAILLNSFSVSRGGIGSRNFPLQSGELTHSSKSAFPNLCFLKNTLESHSGHLKYGYGYFSVISSWLSFCTRAFSFASRCSLLGISALFFLRRPGLFNVAE